MSSERGPERRSSWNKMSISVEVKTKLIQEYRLHAGDTGSPEVQIAILSGRIQELTEHLKANLKDHAARRGLLKMVGRRAGLLKYLTHTDRTRYQKVITNLGLRK